MVTDLQDLVNGIDWIAARFAGKTCVELDVDRQSVTRLGAAAQTDALIREEVTQLGRVEGEPLENVAAPMDAMTRHEGFCP